MQAFYKLAAFAGVVAAFSALHAPTADAQSAARLFFEGDTVRGIPSTGPTGPICVLNSQFKHKEEIVWRVRVLDGRNGKPVDDKGLKSLVVQMPNGQSVKLNYGAHPNRGPQTDHFWSGSWAIPADYPTGSFTYTVVATDKQGKTKSWQPFNVGLSQLTVVADAKPPAAAPATPPTK